MIISKSNSYFLNDIKSQKIKALNIIYKYEYNNICYIECPNNTITNDTHKYICNEPKLLTTIIIEEYSESHLLSQKPYSNLITHYFPDYSYPNIITNKNSYNSESITNINSEYYNNNLIIYKQTEHPESSLILYNNTYYSTQIIVPIILINNENIT